MAGKNDGVLSILLELVDKASPELSKFKDNYTKTTDAVVSATDRMASSTEKGTAGMAGAFSRLVGPIAAVTTAVGLLASGLKIAFDAVGRVDDLADMGSKFGYSAAQVGVLDRAVTDAGGSLEAIQGIFGRVATSLSKTDDDSSKASAAFERLGITTEDAGGKTKAYGEIAVEVARKVAKATEDGTLTAQQLADAQLVAGKGIQANAQSIIAFSEAQELANELYKEGIGISEESIKIAGENEKVNAKLSAVWDSIGSQLVEIVIPAFTTMKNALYDSYVNGGLAAAAFNILKAATSAFMWVLQQFGKVVIGVDATVAIMGKSIAGLAYAMDAFMSAPWGSKSKAFKSAFAEVGADIDKIVSNAAKRISELEGLKTASGGVQAPKKGPDAAGNVGGGGGGSTDSKKAASSTVAEWERYLKSLKDQAAQLGMTTREKMLYKIETVAAEMADKKAAATFREKATALAEQISAFEASKKASEEQKKADDAAGMAIKNYMVSLQEEISLLEFEQKTIGMTNEERIIALKTREMEKLGIDATSAGLTQMLDKYQQLLVAKREQSTVDSILAQTDSAKLKNQQDQLILMAKQLELGKITEAQWIESTRVILGTSKDTADTVSEFWVNAAKSMQNAMSSFFFDIMQGKMTDLAGSFKKMIDKMVADYLASQLASLLFGDIKSGSKTSSGGGLVQAAFGALDGMFRAGGGGVNGGNPYIVGEIGPELFVPRSSGTIIPADVTAGMMGGSANNLSVSVQAMDSQDVLRAMDKIKRPLVEMMNGTNRAYNMGGR